MHRQRFLAIALELVNLVAVAGIAVTLAFSLWEAAATVFVGLITADIIWWQGHLVKRQLAFSTFIELDKEWNSPQMIDYRRGIRDSRGQWELSNLEAVLEFFEKLGFFVRVGVLDSRLLYESTLGWYAARYWLFAREGGQITSLRQEVWQDGVYGDLEKLYAKYVRREVGRNRRAREAWEGKCMRSEAKFWEQEAKG